MQIMVKKWGNSAAVRIPAALMDAAGLMVDQPAQLREEAGRLIIEPVVRSAEYDLSELFGQITEHNRHDAVNLGEAVGLETF